LSALQANALGQLARHRRVEIQVMGRIGRQADCAFSRSQVKEAEKGSRTWKLKRFSTELGTPLGVLDAFAVDQLHLGMGRQAPVAGQRDVAQRVLGRGLVLALRLQQFLALLAVDQRTGTRSPRPSTRHTRRSARFAAWPGR
jgi:hypothetical protein